MKISPTSLIIESNEPNRYEIWLPNRTWVGAVFRYDEDYWKIEGENKLISLYTLGQAIGKLIDYALTLNEEDCNEQE